MRLVIVPLLLLFVLATLIAADGPYYRDNTEAYCSSISFDYTLKAITDGVKVEFFALDEDIFTGYVDVVWKLVSSKEGPGFSTPESKNRLTRVSPDQFQTTLKYDTYDNIDIEIDDSYHIQFHFIFWSVPSDGTATSDNGRVCVTNIFMITPSHE